MKKYLVWAVLSMVFWGFGCGGQSGPDSKDAALLPHPDQSADRSETATHTESARGSEPAEGIHFLDAGGEFKLNINLTCDFINV